MEAIKWSQKKKKNGSNKDFIFSCLILEKTKGNPYNREIYCKLFELITKKQKAPEA